LALCNKCIVEKKITEMELCEKINKVRKEKSNMFNKTRLIKNEKIANFFKKGKSSIWKNAHKNLDTAWILIQLAARLVQSSMDEWGGRFDIILWNIMTWRSATKCLTMKAHNYESMFRWNIRRRNIRQRNIERWK